MFGCESENMKITDIKITPSLGAANRHWYPLVVHFPIAQEDIDALALCRHDTLPAWNYTLYPSPLSEI